MSSKNARRKRRNRTPQAQGPSVTQTVRHIDLAAENERLRAELKRVAPWVQERNDALSDTALDVEAMEAKLREHSEEAVDLCTAFTRTAQTVQEMARDLKARANDVGARLDVPIPEASDQQLQVPGMELTVNRLRARVAKLTENLLMAKRAPAWARRVIREGHRVGDRLVTFSPSGLADPSMMTAPQQQAVFQIGLRLLRDASLAERTDGAQEPAPNDLKDRILERHNERARERSEDIERLKGMSRVEEFATFFGVSERTMRRWLNSGKPCGITMEVRPGDGDKRYVVDPDAALAFRYERETA